MPFSKSRSKRSMLGLAGLTLCVSIFGPPAIGQQAPAPLADTNLVNVLATVRDKHGKIVNNLSQNDFILEENGRQQTIRDFSRADELPLTLGLLVDTGSSQRRAVEQERSASGHFIDQVLREDKDKAFLIHFDREVELLQDLTPSKQKMATALDALQRPQFKQNDDDTSGGSGNPRGGRGSGRGQMGSALCDSIYLAANELMLKQAGRKAIIVFSSGVDRGSKVTLARAIEAAQRANTLVYSVLLVGKQDSGDGGGWGRGGGMGGPMGPMGGPMGGGRGGGGRYPRSPESQQERNKDILERISRETGGRLFEASKKETVDQIYQTIQEDLRNQYSLSYVPGTPGDASEYRKIRATTTQKELAVQARDGYYPAKQLEVKQEDAKQEKGQN